MRLVAWRPDDFLNRLDDVVDVYGQAMSYGPKMLESRRGYMATHVSRAGFCAVATIDETGRLAGFGYGYASSTGQWWHDQVSSGAASATSDGCG